MVARRARGEFTMSARCETCKHWSNEPKEP